MSREAAMLRVVKLGGSLITFPGLVPAFREWYLAQAPGNTVVVTGGGPFVDVIRDVDRHAVIGPDEAHWLCVRLLDVTARLLHMLLPETQFCDRFDELVRRLEETRDGLFAFSVEEFLQLHHPTASGLPLPENWTVTSDSIAAILARALAADELVLLKSADVPEGDTALDLARAGYVDEFLPYALGPALRFRCVNLRQGGEWLIPYQEAL